MAESQIIEMHGDDHDERKAAIVNSPRRQDLAVPERGPEAIGSLLSAAVDSNLPVESIEKLVGLYERREDKAAAQAFADAMAAFQSECPIIRHNRKAAFSTTSGQAVSYTYADLAGVVEVVQPHLHKHGLTFRWSATKDECECILSHRDGHSISSTSAILVDQNKLRSSAQNRQAAVTYAKRQALVDVLGITSADTDVDGAQGHAPVSDAKITEQQANDLRAMAAEIGGNEAAMFSYLSNRYHCDIETWEDIPASAHAAVLKTLEEKRKAKAEAAR